MPLVLVRYSTAIHPRAVGEIADDLRSFVAEVLTAQEAESKLSPSDIEVWVEEEKTCDVSLHTLQIVIFANDYPSRRAKLDQARALIVSRLKARLPDYLRRWPSRKLPDPKGRFGLKGYVWVLLCPSSFGEFHIL